jgi:hypothetical protein
MQKIDYAHYEKPSDFAKFAEGNTLMRIVSSGVLSKKHGTRMGGRFVPLGECTETADCPFCKQGSEPKLKWIWIIYLPESKQVRILETGPQAGDQICVIARKIARAKEDIQDYELKMFKSGTGMSSKYTVTQGEKKKLSPDEEEFIKQSKPFLIKKYFTPKEGQEKK